MFPASMSQQIKHKLEQIKGEYLQASRPTRTVANNLNRSINDDFSSESYIDELLQNANDASIEEEGITKPITVNINTWTDEQGDSYVMVSHSGKPFTDADVDGLCDVASDRRDKPNRDDATGDKGIGFKSLFKITPCAYVETDGIIFRFDEHHVEYDECLAAATAAAACTDFEKKHFPWQIIPFLTNLEELPAKAKKFLATAKTRDQKVSVILKLRDPAYITQINKALEQKLADHRIILFLKNIVSVTVNGRTLEKEYDTIKIVKPFEIQNLSTILSNDASTAAEEPNRKFWLSVKSTAALPAELRSLDPKDVPKKYVENPIQINIVFRLDKTKKRFLPLENVVGNTLFHTLPTAINLNFRFLVNVRLLLNSSRKNFREDDVGKRWNTTVLKLVYALQLKFLAFAATQKNFEFWKDVARLVAIPRELFSKNLHFTEIYEEFSRLFRETPLLRSVSGDTCLAIPGAKYDRGCFVTNLGTEQQRRTTVAEEILSPLDSFPKELSWSYYSLQKIIDFIKQPEFKPLIQTPANYAIFIRFLNTYKDREEFKYPLWNELSQQPVILTNQPEPTDPEKFILTRSTHVYLPNPDLRFDPAIAAQVSIVHPTISTEDNAALFDRGKLDVKPLTLEVLIQKSNAPEFFVKLLHILFQLYKSGTLTTEDVAALQFLGRNAQSRSPHKYYAVDLLRPKHALQGFFSPEHQDVFLDTDRYEIQSDFPAWSLFFSWLGVQNELSLRNIDFYIALINKQKDPERLIQFTRFLVLEWLPQLEIETRNRAITQLKKLHIVARDDRHTDIVPADKSYLADDYNPAIRLQTCVNSILFVVHEYIASRDEIEQWNTFFKNIGVRDSIAITRSKTHESTSELKKLGKLVNEYIDALIKGNAPFNFKKIAVSNYITGFYSFEFIDELIYTEFFWKKIAEFPVEDQKSQIDWSNETIATSLYFFVQKAIFAKQEKIAAELLAPVLYARFEDFLDPIHTCNSASNLSAAQQAYYGFSHILQPWHAIEILSAVNQKLSTPEPRKIKSSERTVLIALYEEILLSHDHDPEPWLELSTQKQFDALQYLTNDAFLGIRSTLLCIDDPKLHSSNMNPNLFWLPATIAYNKAQRNKLLDIFSIRLVESNELSHDATNSNISASPLGIALENNLDLLCFYEAQQRLSHADSTDPEFKAICRSIIEQYYKLIREINELSIPTICLSFEDRFSVNLTIYRSLAERRFLLHGKINLSSIHDAAKLTELSLNIGSILNIAATQIQELMIQPREALLSQAERMGFISAFSDYISALKEEVKAMPIQDFDIRELVDGENSLLETEDEAIDSEALQARAERDPNPVYSDEELLIPAFSTPVHSRRVLNTSFGCSTSSFSASSSRNIVVDSPSFPAQHNTSTASAEQSKKTSEIGWIGEKYAYNHFLKEAEKKVGADNVRRKPGSFDFTDGSKHEKYEQMNYQAIIEENSGYDSKGPYDIRHTIIHADGIRERELIEVKTTTRDYVTFSAGEWNKAMRPCSPDTTTQECPHCKPAAPCRYGLFYVELEVNAARTSYLVKDGRYIKPFNASVVGGAAKPKYVISSSTLKR